MSDTTELKPSGYTPAHVVNTILDIVNRDGGALTHLKLQKILYFSHAWFLAFESKSLINEPFVAWKFGPVCERVYQEYRGFGAREIPLSRNNYMGFFSDEGYKTPIVEDGEVLTHIKKVWNAYKQFTGEQLSSMTHQQNERITHRDNPWKIAREKGANDGIGNGYVIRNSDIKDYFVALRSVGMKA